MKEGGMKEGRLLAFKGALTQVVLAHPFHGLLSLICLPSFLLIPRLSGTRNVHTCDRVN